MTFVTLHIITMTYGGPYSFPFTKGTFQSRWQGFPEFPHAWNKTQCKKQFVFSLCLEMFRVLLRQPAVPQSVEEADTWFWAARQGASWSGSEQPASSCGWDERDATPVLLPAPSSRFIPREATLLLCSLTQMDDWTLGDELDDPASPLVAVMLES